ncbi:hypothetical protein OEZ85_005653 [Tetradesmus obliquus]|uniref:FAS1 domain-containing protein n=1 Tax=Tetradesmus obliquus TaxID=3088 RepID=A0ABY8UHD8_TETOB|nr:hypothetical protein OEZ85_005653 [Tetradesmus obliquus]
MNRVAIAVFVLHALLATCQGAVEPLTKAAALASTGDNRLWARLVGALKLTVDEDKAYVTMLVPTDRAVNAFLKEMGLSIEQLLARPVLVDALVSYHMIPGIAISSFYNKNKYEGNKDLISSNADSPTVFATADVNDVIKAYKSPATGLIALLDAQGHRSVVVGGGSKYGNIYLYDVSAVLLSSSVFYNAPDAFRFYPQWSSAADLYSKAALYSDTLADTFKGQADSTFLVPNNAALKDTARVLVAAPAEALVQVMEYHVVPGVRPVPEGWTNNAKVDTMLPGHSMTAQLSTTPILDAFTDDQVPAPVLTLVSDAGSKARIVAYNIFAGRCLMLALDAPLIPNIPAAGQLLAQAGSGGRRGLLQRHRQSQRFNNFGQTRSQAALMAAMRGGNPAGRASSSWVGNYNTCPNCRTWVGTV